VQRNPQFVTDVEGRKAPVVLPIEEYVEMMEGFEMGRAIRESKGQPPGWWCHLEWNPFPDAGHSRESGNPVRGQGISKGLRSGLPPFGKLRASFSRE
jgi:hypothetical protein